VNSSVGYDMTDDSVEAMLFTPFKLAILKSIVKYKSIDVNNINLHTY
jgi:hypothetical protein